MDRHLNTVLRLSQKVSELTEEKAGMLDLALMLRNRIETLEKENARLKADLKELNQFVYGKEKTNKKK